MATLPPTKRLLPIGIQDFPDIRERGFVYVDKTARASFAETLVKHGLRVPPDKGNALYSCLVEALYGGDVDAALNAVKLFLAEIPYDMILEKSVTDLLHQARFPQELLTR